ncbi:S-adenosylmethionine:tRNA ribosyltransferase-isomerase [Novosphingobium colocasiae]
MAKPSWRGSTPIWRRSRRRSGSDPPLYSLGRIIAAGTTAQGLLESAAAPDGTIEPFEGDTAIFITPPLPLLRDRRPDDHFRLPKSTLFMLVSALMGLERLQAVYAHAIGEGYRFYSYGDSNLLRPEV